MEPLQFHRDGCSRGQLTAQGHDHAFAQVGAIALVAEPIFFIGSNGGQRVDIAVIIFGYGFRLARDLPLQGNFRIRFMDVPHQDDARAQVAASLIQVGLIVGIIEQAPRAKRNPQVQAQAKRLFANGVLKQVRAPQGNAAGAYERLPIVAVTTTVPALVEV